MEKPTRDELEKTYAEHKSIYKLAVLYGCSKSTIYNWMNLYKIETIPRKGRKLPNEVREKVIRTLKRGQMRGRTHSEATRKRMSENRKGSRNGNYKGGKTEKIRKFRRTKEYAHWRDTVIKRANGKCELCGREAPLETHHKISLHKDMTKALDINNGQALCHSCHLKADGRKERVC